MHKGTVGFALKMPSCQQLQFSDFSFLRGVFGKKSLFLGKLQQFF